jgi:hypothetical protein
MAGGEGQIKVDGTVGGLKLSPPRRRGLWDFPRELDERKEVVCSSQTPEASASTRKLGCWMSGYRPLGLMHAWDQRSRWTMRVRCDWKTQRRS